MRYLPILLFAALLPSGCVNYAHKVADRRAELYAKGQGDPVGQAVGREMAAVNADTGADQIPAADVPLTAEAADANEKTIRQGTATKVRLKGFFASLLDELGQRWPLFGAAGGLGVALWRSLVARQAGQALTGTVQAGLELRDMATKGQPLTEDAIKQVFSFWNQLSGAGKTVEGVLTDLKTAWKPPAKDTPAG